MIAFIVLCLAVSTFGAPNSYGYSAPAVRVESSYSAPALKIEAPKAYAAPAIRVEAPAYSSYSAPVKAYEAPIIRKPIIPIVSFVKQDDNYGTMTLAHTSADGTQMNEETHLKNLGDAEGPVSVKSGSYSWQSPEGKTFSVSYTADENGFQASGAHFPVAPVDENHRNLPLAAAPASYGHY